jgi:hypothetical protein
MVCQIRRAVLAQCIGQAGHAALSWGRWLALGQARQQVQRINVLGRAELRADEVQVARRGADVAVARQAADGVRVHCAFEQMGDKAVSQGVSAPALGDVGAVAGA